MRRRAWIPGMIAVLVLMLAARVPSGVAIEPSLAEAVLQSHWETVVARLKADDARAQDPVARLLMAHACLATNRNNAATLLFVSVKEDGDLRTWSAWTDALVRRQPQHPIALYLAADAQARAGRLQDAVATLTQAIQRHPDFALGLNARGVLRVLTVDWENALGDFRLATRLAPTLADAHANVGTYWILREAADGALEAFTLALTLSPEFALAYNGRGAAYFGQGKFEEAAHEFRTAAQFSPLLVMAELNQGFATAYAAQLLTLASLEQTPGTTLESLVQQQQGQLQHRQHVLGKTVSEPQFWTQMQAWPNLPATAQQALIKTYGLANVQTALSHVIEQEALETRKWHREGLAQQRAIGPLAEARPWLGLTKLGTSVTLAGMGTASGLSRAGGWEPWLQGTGALKAELALEKAAVAHLVEHPTVQRALAAIPTSPTLPGIASAAANAWLDRLDARLHDQLAGHMTRQAHALDQQLWHATRLRGLLETFPRAPEAVTPAAPARPSSSLAGFYTSMDRPFTELGALATMVNKTVNLAGGLPRSALLVAQDPFRTSLLQTELSKRGFQTHVAPPGTTDLQRLATQSEANVIVGIKQAELVSQPKYAPFPPGGGGGGAVVRAGGRDPRPPIIGKPFDDWTWGKAFTPMPKGALGGVSTKEIAKAFVDKGNWPVLTAFSLLYATPPTPMVHK